LNTAIARRGRSRCRNSRARCLQKERERNRGAGDDLIREIEQVQIREEQRDAREKDAMQPAGALFLQPILARRRLQMADEVDEDGDDDREDVRRRECRDEEGEGSQQACLQ
jgi:hypothetical protein